MKFTLRASLAVWEARVAARKALHDKAQRDLTRARATGQHPRQALIDRRDLRTKQLAEARAMVAKRKKQIAGEETALPVAFTEDSWGWHPGVHDGIDLICAANAPLHAICKAEVVRADAGGWWGLGAPSDAALKARGDGIIILRSLVDVGPIRKGLNYCYGHAEHATVRVGQVVEAGDVIGKAGFANAWHTHWMVNGRSDAKGVGDRDPKPTVDYLKENA